MLQRVSELEKNILLKTNLQTKLVINNNKKTTNERTNEHASIEGH